MAPKVLIGLHKSTITGETPESGTTAAMIVGGVGVEEGVTGIVMSLLVTVAAAAKFYDASYRTGIARRR